MTDAYAKKRIIRDVTEVRTMKPASAAKNRPMVVKKKTRAQAKREHYAREDR